MRSATVTRPSRWRACTTRTRSRRTASRASWRLRSTSPRTRRSTSSPWGQPTNPGNQAEPRGHADHPRHRDPAGARRVVHRRRLHRRRSRTRGDLHLRSCSGALHARRAHGLAHAPARPDDLRHRGRRALSARSRPDRDNPPRRPRLLPARREPLARRGAEPLHGPHRHAAERRERQSGHLGRARHRRGVPRRDLMARVVITGSADGLERLAADSLLAQGHEVVVHARNRERLAAVSDLLDRGAAAVVGDLSHLDETRHVAEQVNRLGRMDAVIHNAGGVRGPAVLPVNVVAPYLLTALIERPQRLVYLSSGMHRGGRSALAGMDWSGSRTTGTYSDSKLFLTAFAAAVARLWPDVFSNAVDPGWVPTKMGGAGAPDDLRLGHLTQVWLATSEDPGARISGGYWHHQRKAEPAPSVSDERFQDELLESLAHFTGERLL